MRVLLDTMAFLWALGFPERMSRTALTILSREDTLAELSAVSIVEIAIKQSRGKLFFAKEDVLQGIAALNLRVLPFHQEHAHRIFDLPLHHADPFDRQILAQALVEEVPIVTSDRVFHLYKGIKLIW
jgi:PIN domain nuclease of toxin-antitoxin system